MRQPVRNRTPGLIGTSRTEDQRQVLLGGPDLDPPLVPVRVITHDLEAHALGPEVECGLLVGHRNDDLADSGDHERASSSRVDHGRLRYIHIGHIRFGLYPAAVSSARRGVPVLTTAGFQVLLALASGHSHGYAVMGFVDHLTGGQVRLGPGTLYRTLARLVADELVSEIETNDPHAPHDARRRYYQLTPLGAQAVREEADLLARLVAAADNAGLLDRNARTK